MLRAGACLADEPPPETAGRAAERVLAALAAGDEAALTALARGTEPDPWVVADELCALGRHDAAEALARAAPHGTAAKLPAYVAARKTAGEDGALRAKLAALEGAGNEKVLELTEGLAPTGVVPIRMLARRGYALRALGRPAESAQVLRATARAAEGLGWLAGAAHLFHESATSFDAHADYRNALEEWERAIALNDGIDDREGVAAALLNGAGMRIRLGDLVVAAERLERARELFAALGNEGGVLAALGNLAHVHIASGRHASAIASLEPVLEAMRRRQDGAGTATVLAMIGDACQRIGETERAISCDEEAIRIAEPLGLNRIVAVARLNLGRVLYERGDHARALDCYERSIALSEAAQDRHTLANALNNMGNTYFKLGDSRRALGMHRKALALFEAIEDREGVWVALGNIGNAHEHLGEIDEAVACQQRSLALAETAENRTGIARALVNLANLRSRRGDHAAALRLHVIALPHKEATGDVAGTALVLGNIGLFQQKLGMHAEALASDGRALELSRAAGDSRVEVKTLQQLSALHLAMGRPDEALRSAEEALARLPVLVQGLGDEQGALARGQYGELFTAGARAAQRLGDVAAVCRFLESGRAGALLESLGLRGALRATEIPEALRREEAGARADEAEATARLRRAAAKDLDEVKAAKAQLEEARARIREAIARIQREAKREANLLYPEARSLEEIRGGLREGEALLLYGAPEEFAFALVCTAERARVVPLVADRIGPAVEALRVPDEGADPTEACRTLSDLLIRPLDLPEGVTRLLVSPDGALAQVPFALLAPGREVVYVPSATAYLALREGSAARGDGVLALGDPDYRAGAELRTGRPLRRLPESGREATAVGDVTLLRGEATESRLREAVATRERWRSVHLACHGVIDFERPLLSALAITPDAAEDGLLRILDLFRLNVPADLVVVSACVSARGKRFAAEGIFGFTRAFLFAGASRVIVSQWKVDDEATRALMVRFYELWNPRGGAVGLPAATALRRAQESVAAEGRWRHPAFWAGWQLWGLPD